MLSAPFVAKVFLNEMFSCYLLNLSRSFSIPSTKSLASAVLVLVLYLRIRGFLNKLTHDDQFLFLLQTGLNSIRQIFHPL